MDKPITRDHPLVVAAYKNRQYRDWKYDSIDLIGAGLGDQVSIMELTGVLQSLMRGTFGELEIEAVAEYLMKVIFNKYDTPLQ